MPDEFIVLTRHDTAIVQQVVQFFVQDFVDQRTFSLSRGAGDTDEHLQWNGNIQVG